MEKSISLIKKEFQAAPVEELPDLITGYLGDARKGVADIMEKARKRIMEDEAELLRLWEMQSYEREYEAFAPVGGMDEAGRGPLAGPVVAACVILPKDCKIRYINDSKKLSPKKRDYLFDIIHKEAISVGVGIVSHQRIDEINILNATYEAMKAAVDSMDIKPGILLNDAVTVKSIPIRQIPIIKGDAKSLSIGAASIIAKVTRDRIMEEYESTYPGYGFSAHKGYGSESHIAAIKNLGPCPIHRRSFIKNLV